MKSLGEDLGVETFSTREVEILRLLAKGLTNKQIAQRLFLSPGTVKWYNKQIYGKLGVNNRSRAGAKAKELGLLDEAADGPQEIEISPDHNLPAELTSFVGREREMAEVRSLLKSARLVTLTGPGGSGKTRLALRVARQAGGDYADGVAFVGLASTADPARLPNTIAQVLGVVERTDPHLVEQLQRALGKRQLLLVLDNFEHLLPAAPVVTELLAAAPRLTVLATSREALRLRGEHEYLVPPLQVPRSALSGVLADLAANESVALFAQRAQAASHNFRLTEENAADVAAICRRLDGLPLPLELAAARIKLFGPGPMLERLQSRLTVLTGGAQDLPARQQTLRDTIDWSHELLDDGERLLFARLAVFTGGRSLEGVEAVCGPGLSIDALEGLGSLLNKNLIYQEMGPGGEPRFFMLETIHEYARERLAASGEERQIRRRHLDFFVNWLEASEPGYWRQGQLLLFEQTEAEMGNLRSAFNWAMKNGNVEAGARLLSPLEYFMAYKDHFLEGYQWVRRVLAQIEDVPLDHRLRFLLAAGRIAFVNGDLAQSKAFIEQAEVLARELGDSNKLAWSWAYASARLVNRHDPQEIEEGFRLAEKAIALFRQLDDRPGLAQALTNLGNLAKEVGEYERARKAFEECLAVCQETGEVFRESMTRGNLAMVADRQGDYERVQRLAASYLKQMSAIGARRHTTIGLATMAAYFCGTGKPEKAARLLGVSARLTAEIGADYEPSDAAHIRDWTAAARAQLGETAFAAAWAEGQAMDQERAVAYALDEQPHR